MRILQIEPTPAQEIWYLSASSGGGTESRALPIFLGQAEALPAELDALLITSDLQGRAPSPFDEPVLLGVAVAELVSELGMVGLLPHPERTGVILAGDMYAASAADRRGATGDVRRVWSAFSQRFSWVVGVAGNHDTFGTDGQKVRFQDDPKVSLLDGGIVERSGLRIGGVSGISATRRLEQSGRRPPDEQQLLVAGVVKQSPEVLVLHEGPAGPNRSGNRMLNPLAAQVALTICGHSFWETPLMEMGDSQVLNVDSRVVILQRA